MIKSFDRGPLVEVIAELRWPQPGAAEAQPIRNGLRMVPALSGQQHDEMFMRFAGAVYQHGFLRSERTVPAGFPLVPHQVVYQLRKTTGPGSGSELFQIGPGVFTANAIPPYQGWEAFAPVVRTGVNCLLEARGDDKAQFNGVVLRYINAFTPAHLNGRSPSSFLQDVLQIRLDLPRVLNSRTPPNKEIGTAVQLSIPLDGAMVMTVSASEGMVNNEQVLLLDLAIGSSTPIPSAVDDVMQALDSARNIIHETFFALTNSQHPDWGTVEG